MLGIDPFDPFGSILLDQWDFEKGIDPIDPIDLVNPFLSACVELKLEKYGRQSAGLYSTAQSKAGLELDLINHFKNMFLKGVETSASLGLYPTSLDSLIHFYIFTLISKARLLCFVETLIKIERINESTFHPFCQREIIHT